MRLLLLGLLFLSSYAIVCLLDGFLNASTRLEWMNEARATAIINDHEQSQQLVAAASSAFFPVYGTQDFGRHCAWTLHQNSRNYKNSSCTFLIRPPSNGKEGISHWISQIVSSHLLALQMRCRVLFDYGPSVDIQQVIVPHSSSKYGDSPMNWTVPPAFTCEEQQGCFELRETSTNWLYRNVSLTIPNYRLAHRYSRTYFAKMNQFQHLQASLLPNFNLASAMACSLASLWKLSSRASQFEPRLFSSILPTLRRKDLLVLALYIRTGQTEDSVLTNPVGKKAWEATAQTRRQAERVIDCAIRQFEQDEYLRQRRQYSGIVWMVVTDSQLLKEWIRKEYDNALLDNAGGVDGTRRVITTSSRGRHSRPANNPSTADFAEAFIDWYLIGESDYVITDSHAPSFADTAALRTARPIYKVVQEDGGVCTGQGLFGMGATA